MDTSDFRGGWMTHAANDVARAPFPVGVAIGTSNCGAAYYNSADAVTTGKRLFGQHN